jgi:mannose-6-phosphate isomerase
VYDWDRVGSDGKPRPLHIDRALDVIDFHVVCPGAYVPRMVEEGAGLRRAEISRCPYFVVEEVRLEAGAEYEGTLEGATFEIWGCVEGAVEVHWSGEPLALWRVRFCLLPACLGAFMVRARGPATLLRAYAPE